MEKASEATSKLLTSTLSKYSLNRGPSSTILQEGIHSLQERGLIKLKHIEYKHNLVSSRNTSRLTLSIDVPATEGIMCCSSLVLAGRTTWQFCLLE